MAVNGNPPAADLETRLAEAEAILQAIIHHEVDALVVQGVGGEQVYTLKSAELPYRIIVESINEGAATLGQDGTVYYCNQAFADLLGLPLTRAIGNVLADFIAPADRDAYTSLVNLGLTARSKGELLLHNAAGATVPVLLSCSPLALDELQGVCVVATDLSDQKRQAEHLLQTRLRLEQEIALRESEQRFRSTFEQAAVGIAHVALDGRYLRVNQRICEITGYSREWLLQLSYQEISHPEDVDIDVELRRQMLVGTRDGLRIEKRYVRPDGSAVWVQVTGSLARDETTHAPLYYISVVEDITERRRLLHATQHAEAELRLLNETLEARVAERTAELERSNRELDRFAYVASHDLKAPLRAIDNLAKWIEADASDVLPQPTQEHLQKLRGRVQRMEHLLEDLLAYSRAGRIQHKCEPVDTAALVHGVFDLLAPPPDFRLVAGGDLPVLETQRVPLETVLRNLIGNAIKHHGQGTHQGTSQGPGQVRVTARDLGPWVEFTVADDGPGIEPQYHERIFEIFQTLQPRDRVEGSGMGLAIVKKTVESVGGTVTVVSRAGRGASFRFTWPRELPAVVE